MDKLQSREELSQYVLRKLGEPVIMVNVAEEQVEDRIEEALQLFFEGHSDGTERRFFAHTVTQADIDNEYLDLDAIDEKIESVSRIVALDSGMYSVNFMNSIYQYRLALHNGLLNSGGVDDYYIAMQYLNTIERVFENGHVIDFNKNSNKLRIRTNWADEFTPDESVVAFECHVWLDENIDTELFNHSIVKELAYLLVKKQWGENLKKMKGIQMAGGVELDGQGIYDEAEEGLKEMKEKLEDMPQGLFLY